MSVLQTEVLVIGGGATGTGVLRDLAMRGFKCLLVEMGDLTHGTTGRYHGLLHSGGRYAVKDPQAAGECIAENTILRRIMPQCIEDTSGFFVVTPWDDPGYAPRFLDGCRAAGIPVEEISISEMLRQEPLLNPGIIRCFRVPDASADSFLGAHLNVESARQYGAEWRTYHRVERLLISENGSPHVAGAFCQDLASGEQVTIHADLVVNAAGAWAGRVAASAGLNVRIIPGKGTLLAANHRPVHTIINRCRPPSDGDILVPAHTVAVIGTTDIKVEDPSHFAIEPWEVDLLLEEGDKLVPGFKHMRMLRAWAGVRPLYQETGTQTPAGDNRSVTRAFVLLDHAARDGLPGLVTITGGKWTTYRKMAEVTADLVCSQLGVQRPCRTHLEPLPSHPPPAHFHLLGSRLAEIEDAAAYGSLVCECELVTRPQVENALLHAQANTFDDIRRDVRLGMGPCQGGFCTFRLAGIWQELSANGVLPPGTLDPALINASLRDFLQERWKGILPVLWGQQLRQEMLNSLIYLDVLNADHLPSLPSTRLAPENYTPPAAVETSLSEHPLHPLPEIPPPPTPPASDVLVIGAGLAGLTAAWQAAESGLRVLVLAEGWGATHWHSGCIGVLGYDSWLPEAPLFSPEEALDRLIRRQPDHPYALVGMETIKSSLESFALLCSTANYPLHGSLDRNWLLPSALGSARPVCYAPRTMLAGDLSDPTPALIVGFSAYPDFYPHLVSANLEAQGIPAAAIQLDLPALNQRKFNNSRTLAQAFEDPEFRQAVIEALRPLLGRAGRVGFPAVLGMNDATAVHHGLESGLNLPVFEMPTLPASIPGMRLHHVLLSAIQRRAGRVAEGVQVHGAQVWQGEITGLLSQASVRSRVYRAGSYILATGGILGGGIHTDSHGYAQETIFSLPLSASPHRQNWFQRDFLSPLGHPIFSAGVRTNSRLQPVDSAGQVIYANLFAAGSALAEADPIRERSLEGIALSTGFSIARRLAKPL